MGRIKVTLDTPQKRMLQAIARHYGGPTKAARYLNDKYKLKVSKQDFVNWSVRGVVPLERVLILAKALNVSPYCLNYEGYTEMTATEKPFKEVVAECNLLLEDTKKWVLSGKLSITKK